MKKIDKFFLVFLLLMPFQLFGVTLVDPTRPPEIILAPKKLNIQKNLKLTATFIYLTDRLAIISGSTVKVGDHIGELTISNINSNTVELTGPDESKQVLTLISPIKQKR